MAWRPLPPQSLGNDLDQSHTSPTVLQWRQFLSKGWLMSTLSVSESSPVALAEHASLSPGESSC